MDDNDQKSLALTGYEAMRERARARNAMLSLSGRDIGDLTAVIDPARRARAAKDFRYFCDAYFPQTFRLKWSNDHLKVIAKIERSVVEGGLFAMAMPRGSGKTSLCEAACLWALLYGHREFVALIGSDEEHAADMLESIKAELENSELLAGDFPEVCHPIRSLEGIHQRASGQLYRGKQTHIGWTAKEIVLPTIEGSAASGSIIRVAGITGRIRGMKHKRVDGVSVRPSLVLIDDPQTDESAASPSQCAARERVLSGAILGLAGPGRKIAGLATLTVMRSGDVADRLLDPQRNPHWQGERTKMMYSEPANSQLWDQYALVLAESHRSGLGITLANVFYAEHRAEMDAGAVIAWPERFNHDELSAIQHAMNLKIRDEVSFLAEYQNEPRGVDAYADEFAFDAGRVLACVTEDRPRYVPARTVRITAAVDVQASLLYYVVCAWRDDRLCSVIEYGSHPDQGRPYFTLRDARHKLPEDNTQTGQAIVDLCRAICDRRYEAPDGHLNYVGRVLVDAAWGASSESVYSATRTLASYRCPVMPSHGQSMAVWHSSSRHRVNGDTYSAHWRIPKDASRGVRRVLVDANGAKDRVALMVRAGPDQAGGLRLHVGEHRMFADHLSSEERTPVIVQGEHRSMWKITSPGTDNHLLDCMAMAWVANDIEGNPTGSEPRPTPPGVVYDVPSGYVPRSKVRSRR
ncbi:MAG: hypothetical protein C0511_15000 [Hyphomicrobium sp.]|nr:hypothetical protein [Hyphomicrobium sp.]